MCLTQDHSFTNSQCTVHCTARLISPTLCRLTHLIYPYIYGQRKCAFPMKKVYFYKGTDILKTEREHLNFRLTCHVLFVSFTQ